MIYNAFNYKHCQKGLISKLRSFASAIAKSMETEQIAMNKIF